MAKATGKTTTPKAVKAASKVMADGRTGPRSKTAASALSQAALKRTAPKRT